MVSNEPTDSIINVQQNALSSKYTVHQALVAQQNLYGIKNGTYQMGLQSGDKRSFQNRSEMQQMQGTGHTFESVSESQVRSSQLVSVESNGQAVRAVPFKRQTSIAPPTRQSQSINESRAPNQLFMRLKQ